VIHWALRGSPASAGGGGGSPGEGTAAYAQGGGPLTAAERTRLAGFGVAKRRADWLVGRITAKVVVARAMQEVLPGKWPLDAIEIATEPSGAPCARLAGEASPIAGFAPGEWLPISVTISHAEERALCAATCSPRPPAPARERQGDGCGNRRGVLLGADLGAIEPRSPAFVETFLTSDEQRFVRDGPGGERDLRANLVWCAKEAVLKSLGLGLTVDTLELSCLPAPGALDPAVWRMSPAESGWRPFVVACGPALVEGGGRIRGLWRAFGGFVGTLAARG
jgi:4'-phosphopantetheinyl transferase